MSQVAGTTGSRANTVTRRDRRGRPISIGDELPDSKAILFTGPTGMGKSFELAHAKARAVQNGWTAIEVTASAGSPLKHQIILAIERDREELRAQLGRRKTRRLGKWAWDLSRRARNLQFGLEWRFGAGFVQGIFKKQWDATRRRKLDATLTDFADHLGDLAESTDQPVLLLVDDVDDAPDEDLAALTELAIHLEQQGREVYLIAAGGATATGKLMKASGRMSTVSNPFDIRELPPLSDDDLRPVLTGRLDGAEVSYRPDTIDSLLRSANGAPGRLNQLTDAALRFADRRAGITGDTVTAAIAGVDADAERGYQARWNTSSPAQKSLLAAVAAQGPNGLSILAGTRAAGPGEWQAIDKARQKLVARGLLREHSDHRVTIAETGFRDWVNDYLQQTPAPADPTATQAPAETSHQPAGIAASQPAGDRIRVSDVLGPAREPKKEIKRFDRYGRPISLDQRITDGKNTVLFTGPTGTGTSRELDKTQALADKNGWTAIRVDATKSEPLENRIIRALNQDMDKFRARYGESATRTLKSNLGRLAAYVQKSQSAAELRAGLPGVAQVAAGVRWDDASRENVGATLIELADQLGELAAEKHEPTFLLVDNLDIASDRELKALIGLAKHLDETRHPVFLVGAGGQLTLTDLLAASAGRDGVETIDPDLFDVRDVDPLTTPELEEALSEPLDNAKIPYELDAVRQLATAANGIPSRLRDLASSALELTDRRTGITTDVARAAVIQLHDQSQKLYEGAWYYCDDSEKQVLARVAVHGSRGLALPAATEPSGDARWDLDEAGQRLVARGLLRVTGRRIVSVADPGLQNWVQARLGYSAAQSGVAHPSAQAQPQLTATGEHPAGRHALAPTREHGNRTANR